MEPTWGLGVGGLSGVTLGLQVKHPKSVPPAEVLVQLQRLRPLARRSRPGDWAARRVPAGPRGPSPCGGALVAAALGAPLGVRYLTAGAQERRRMRLVVDGVGRFSR